MLILCTLQNMKMKFCKNSNKVGEILNYQNFCKVENSSD